MYYIIHTAGLRAYSRESYYNYMGRFKENLFSQVNNSVAFIQAAPPGYFPHISITTPVVSALKNYYR
jgi:hypothetical protein